MVHVLRGIRSAVVVCRHERVAIVTGAARGIGAAIAGCCCIRGSIA